MTTPRAASWMDRLAHDLRGPLSPMQTAVYLLRDELVVGSERAELLAVMERQLRRLGGMIDEVSDLGRAEKGRLVARREPLDLELLIADITARLHARPPEITFAPDVQTVELNGDVLRLGQLFRVLLGLQLTRGVPAAVQAHIAWAAPGRLRMVCVVPCHDATDALAHALLAMPQTDPPDEGLGLGVMIACAIAEAHGGHLEAQAGNHAVELVLELPARPSA
ncbi:MAG: sensor histidine kinase [Luteimonas sp.]